MIGNISPAESACEHSLNTLRYSDRVKELKSGDDGKKLSTKEMLAKELMLPRLSSQSKTILLEKKQFVIINSLNLINFN
jgi:hypothetical protein